jgi:putative FmdB family regulatory protein
MPIYEYVCKGCGLEFEELVRGDEQPGCPACGKEDVERQMSAPAAHMAIAGQASCPSRDVCGSHCCGPNCGMH